MILSSGIDLIEIGRIQKALERHGERFLKRIFTDAEIIPLRSKRIATAEPRVIAAELAARFAAKEAASKALGTGIGPISWQEIEVLNEPSGKPTLRLSGKAAQIASILGYTSWSVSLTHSRDMAAAVVVCVGEEK
ncbi:MAG: holo-[acyl-carrier-protein] synthase [Anaerolineales bacterium]|nr:holo-[acyl-carrier-protein] synthase [Anaerolineales bacterium]